MNKEFNWDYLKILIKKKHIGDVNKIGSPLEFQFNLNVMKIIKYGNTTFTNKWDRNDFIKRLEILGERDFAKWVEEQTKIK